MVMHIPTQPGEKVQLQVMMNMNEARQPPQAQGALLEELGCIECWICKASTSGSPRWPSPTYDSVDTLLETSADGDSRGWGGDKLVVQEMCGEHLQQRKL